MKNVALVLSSGGTQGCSQFNKINIWVLTVSFYLP
jgi:hypothetical protein